MNYHSHEHRDEVWTILSGEGRTIVDGMDRVSGQEMLLRCLQDVVILLLLRQNYR